MTTDTPATKGLSTDPRMQGAPQGQPMQHSPPHDLVGALPAAVYTARCGGSGEWFYVSPEIEAILGFTPEEFIADPSLWARQLHPDDSAWVLADDEASESSGEKRLYAEYRMIAKDGRVVWILDDTSLLREAGHRILQHGLLSDITLRKRRELLLAEQSDILERVARGDDLVTTLQALASSIQAVTGAVSCAVVVRHDGERRGGRAVNGDGLVEPTESSFDDRVPFHDPHGELLGHILVEGASADSALRSESGQLDVAWAGRLAALAVRRGEQEERTATSYSLLEATLESTADGILVIDRSGRIADHNQKFLRMWRVPDELIAAGDDGPLIEYVLEQLCDPDAFVAEISRLYEAPELSSFDVLEFQDDRVFERYSQPQRLDGQSVGRVWSFRDVTDYRRLEAELRVQAHTDTLTALPNRHMLMERLAALVARPDEEPNQTEVGLLLIDLDDFKTVNDGLGHAAGDALLVRVAERIRNCVRGEDMPARLGGDEFVVLLESPTDGDHASLVAERILAALREPMDVEGRMISIRASVGIALAGSGVACENLLRNADLAMYTAKRDGGADYRIYASPMHGEAVARLDLKSDLARAIDQGALTVDYQPIVSLDTEQITGFEALARWHHPQHGLIPLVDFIPLAEEMGLIDSVGRWVLAEACAEAVRWQEMCGVGEAPSVSVNLSPLQLSNFALTAEIREVLTATGLPAASLCLEITESALGQSSVDVVGVLNGLRSLGVRLALDDFGTGHSSLSRLGGYPFDIIKVDRSFINKLVEGDRDVAIVEAVVMIAEAFELDVVAEGIETEPQLAALQALGCGSGQGYLFSKPVRAQCARQMLVASSDPLRSATDPHSDHTTET